MGHMANRILTAAVAGAVVATGVALLPGAAGAVQPGNAVNVGNQPWGAAVSPDSSEAYVTNKADNTVSVVAFTPAPGGGTGAVAATITGFASPEGVAFTPDGSRAYVANEAGGGSVAIVYTGSRTVAATIPLLGEPSQVAVTPDGKYVLVTRSAVNRVSVISVATNAQVAEVEVGVNPQGIAVSTDGTRAYVANQDDGTVTTIQINSAAGIFSREAAAIPVGAQPRWVATAPNLPSQAYVGNYAANSVSVIGGLTVVGSVPGVASPTGIASAADGKTVYAASRSGNSLLAINPNSLNVTGSTSLAPATEPESVAVAPDGSWGIVADRGTNNASIVLLAPVVSASSASGVTGTSAQANARVQTHAAAASAVRCYYGADSDQVALGPNATTGAVASVRATPSTVGAGSASQVSCELPDLSRSSTYYYTVAAQNTDGWGWDTEPVMFTTRPKKPSGFSVKKKNKQLIWRWSKVAAADYYQTRLYKNGKWTSWRKVTATKVKYSKLQRKTKYQVQVRAANDSGAGPRRTKKAKTT